MAQTTVCFCKGNLELSKENLISSMCHNSVFLSYHPYHVVPILVVASWPKMAAGVPGVMYVFQAGS